MSRTLDVNVLVYAADRSADRHERARAFLDHVATTRTITYLFWPVILGYFRIVTHAGILRSPLSPTAAIDDVEDLIHRPQMIVVGEGEQFWTTFRAVAAVTPPRGPLVLDAHLVALMREHGVTTMWSGDRDFRKFDGITVKNPFEQRYSAGFE